MHVPAFCDTCGAVFRSGLMVESGASETLADKQSGACPVCGSVGRVRDDVFDLIGRLIQVLSAPERTADEVMRLVEILSGASERKERPEEVARRIASELPALAPLADLMPKAAEELNSFISMTVGIAGLLWRKGADASGGRNITVEQALSHLFKETNVVARSRDPVSRPHVRRNAPCPCGSGKRYKRCCGRAA